MYKLWRHYTSLSFVKEMFVIFFRSERMLQLCLQLQWSWCRVSNEILPIEWFIPQIWVSVIVSLLPKQAWPVTELLIMLWVRERDVKPNYEPCVINMTKCDYITFHLNKQDLLLFTCYRYECVDEPWNVDTANVVVCPETDEQGRDLYCHTFTQQIKGEDPLLPYLHSTN